jgi:hypothetical protein
MNTPVDLAERIPRGLLRLGLIHDFAGHDDLSEPAVLSLDGASSDQFFRGRFWRLTRPGGQSEARRVADG